MPTGNQDGLLGGHCRRWCAGPMSMRGRCKRKYCSAPLSPAEATCTSLRLCACLAAQRRKHRERREEGGGVGGERWRSQQVGIGIPGPCNFVENLDAEQPRKAGKKEGETELKGRRRSSIGEHCLFLPCARVLLCICARTQFHCRRSGRRDRYAQPTSMHAPAYPCRCRCRCRDTPERDAGIDTKCMMMVR